MLKRAFPDLQIKSRFSWRGKIESPGNGRYGARTRAISMGFPANGRRIVWRDMVTSQFRHGLIAEEWVITDPSQSVYCSQGNPDLC